MTEPYTRAPAPDGHRDGRGYADTDDARQDTRPHVDPATLALLLGNGVHELRAPKAGRSRTVSGYFDDPTALAAAAESWSGRVPGVYVSINPAVPALLARSANRAQPYAEQTTSDRDIARRTRLYVDCDPVRPSGIASTHDEHGAALDRVQAIADDLRDRGWPAPIVMDSGNGAALFYAVDLPNDAEAAALVAGVLAALHEQYSDDVVKVDTTVSNAARIARIPGTLNAKGDDTPDRPHRYCRVIAAPSMLDVVPRELLEALAGESAAPEREQATDSHGSAYDIDGFIARHGLKIRREDPWEGGRRIQLEHCPFNAEHTGGSAALFVMASGALAFKCQHDGCAGRKWEDVRELFEPDRRHRSNGDARGEHHDDVATPSAPPWPAPLGDAAYIGPLGQFVRLLEPHTEADPAALLIQALAAFGSVAGRHRYYRVEGDRHHSNLFVCLVGATSKGRKGTSWGRTRGLLRTVDDRWQNLSGLASGEGLIWAIRDPIVERKRQKGGTYEDVEADPGVEDKRLLVVESEFARVLAIIQRQGATLSDVVRDAWDRDELRTATKNSPARATDPHISIIAHVTRDELRRELTSTETANGFANRYLFAAVRRSKELPFGGQPDTVELSGIVRRLTDAISLAGAPGEMAFDDAARERWIDGYSALSSDRPGLLGAATARAEAQVVRLALIYALADGADEICLRHLDAGLEVWRFCAASAAWIFGDSLGDRIADATLAAIRSAGPDGVSRTDLRDRLGKGYGDRLTAALATLSSAGLAHGRRIETGGRPAERWFPGRSPGSAPSPKAPKAPKGGSDSEKAGPLGALGGLGEGAASEEHDEIPVPDDSYAPKEPGDGWDGEAWL